MSATQLWLTILVYRLDIVAATVPGVLVTLALHLWLVRRRGTAGLSRQTWIALAALGIAGVVGAEAWGRAERRQLRGMVEGFAPTYALQLEQLGHAALPDDVSPDDPRYLALIEAEKAWLAVNPAVMDVYTFRLDAHQRPVLFVDSETDYDRNGAFEGDRESRTVPGAVYDKMESDIHMAFLGRALFVDHPYVDAWGTWVSALVPMRDPASGRIEAVLGVDYPASSWVSAILSSRGAALAIMAFLCSLVTGRGVSRALITVELARRAKAEDEVRRSEQRFRTLSQHAPVGIFQTDAEGRCTYVNDRWCEITGRSFEFARGDRWQQSIHPEDRAGVVEHWRGLVAGGARKALRFRFERPTGEARWVFGAATLLQDGNDQPAGFLGTVWDVTDQRSVENELLRVRDEALNSARLKSEFLANMSHEIRTPMNGVLGMLDLLLDSELTPEQRESAELAHRSGTSLLALLNDILDFSKIEAGKLLIETVPFDLLRLVNDLLEAFTPAAASKGLALEVFYDSRMPSAVVGDAVRIRQILTNLIGNALKFTQQGHVRISMRAGERDATRVPVAMEVEDTGIGIAADRIGHVFGKFTQGDSSTTRKFGGTGLGLAISQQLAELMGGTITARSEVGVGSCFTLSIPLQVGTATVRSERPVAAGQLQAAPVPEPIGDSLERLGLEVLVAEDNSVNQRVAARMLTKLGCKVDVVGDGREAVQRSAAKRYDVILMDCQMPEMDGFEATVAIRDREAAEGGRHTPIVALTAHAFASDRERCLDCGMDDYLTKPLRREELHGMLGRFVEPKGAGGVADVPPSGGAGADATELGSVGAAAGSQAA